MTRAQSGQLDWRDQRSFGGVDRRSLPARLAGGADARTHQCESVARAGAAPWRRRLRQTRRR
eukprot:403525-Pyramimonas_sp.AAC.1